MADIVIRGMAKMPGNCRECMFAGFGGMRNELNVCMFSGESQSLLSYERMSKCPLLPLPEGHGKLIDIKDVESEKFHIEGRAEMYSAYNIGWNDALDTVCKNVSSVIPAEGGNADGNP